jgi:hypothetical protein
MREGMKRDRDVGQGGRKGEEEGRERGMDAWEEECGVRGRDKVG